MDFLDELFEFVRDNPLKSSKEYAKLLRDEGFDGITKKDLNSIFYSSKQIYMNVISDDGVPLWLVIGDICKSDKDDIKGNIDAFDLDFEDNCINTCKNCEKSHNKTCSRDFLDIVCEEFSELESTFK